MARGPICSHCDEKLAPKQVFCGKCGHPTAHASHDERVLWDLGQWEASRRRTAAADPSRSGSASESAGRTKELFHSAKGKAAESSQALRQAEAATTPPEAPRRFLMGRIRREQHPAPAPAKPAASTPAPARPAASAPAPVAPRRESVAPGQAPPASAPAPQRGVPVRPAASTKTPPSAPPRPNGVPRSTTPAARPPASARPAAPAAQAPPPPAATRVSTARASTIAPERPGPAKTNETRVAASAAPVDAPPVTHRAAKAAPVDAPLVTIRRAATEAEAVAPVPAQAVAAPVKPAAPAAPSRSERKALEEQQREAERLRKKEEKEAARLAEEKKKEAERLRAAEKKKEAERLKAEQKKEAERLKAEQEKEAERRRNEEAKDARKRERKHKRHSKRVNRRAAELDLRSGERVSLSISGWSRFRRATLVVTNYRVALITRMLGQVRWIPLEEVEDVHHRWFGAHSLVVTSPIEVLTLQKAKHQVLGSFEQILESEVAEARKPGATERHHGDITQEWCDRSTEIWDSSFGRLRLWIRRHPVFSFGTLAMLAVAAFVLSTILNT